MVEHRFHLAADLHQLISSEFAGGQCSAFRWTTVGNHPPAVRRWDWYVVFPADRGDPSGRGAKIFAYVFYAFRPDKVVECYAGCGGHAAIS